MHRSLIPVPTRLKALNAVSPTKELTTQIPLPNKSRQLEGQLGNSTRSSAVTNKIKKIEGADLDCKGQIKRIGALQLDIKRADIFAEDRTKLALQFCALLPHLKVSEGLHAQRIGIEAAEGIYDSLSSRGKLEMASELAKVLPDIHQFEKPRRPEDKITINPRFSIRNASPRNVNPTVQHVTEYKKTDVQSAFATKILSVIINDAK